MSDERLRAVTIGEPTVLDGPVRLAASDSEWPRRFEREAQLVAEALGDRAQRVEHVGSTAVPGLAAKPIIDMLLVVGDSADEPAYVPDLERVGFALRIREPDWFEHRLFRDGAATINLHVFSAGCVEVDRMIRFRDRLRADASDRALYAHRKRELAARTWRYLQDYADAKSAVVEEIISRAG